MVSLPHPRAGLLAGAALFLDFDGTLVELAETPDAIRVPPSLAPLLAKLRDRLHGRLALVSGRALADLERHVAVPGVPCSGSHGLELRLGDGTHVPLHRPVGVQELRERVQSFASKSEGLLVEDKPAGVALHYRLDPGAAAGVGGFMEEVAAAHGFVVQRGNMVVELRPPGADKGDAVRALMKEPPFVGGRPLFVGDDLTDEHAFAAVAELGGAGILVGPERDTAACYRLPSVGSVSDWLEAFA